jgi:hypothetical protein
MLKRLVKLVVEMSEPELALIGTACLSSLINQLTDLVEVLFPKSFILKKVYVHQLYNHVHNSHVDLTKAPVF